MASSGKKSGGEEAREMAAELGKTLKEGERLVGPTRRPDGTLRKPFRIRAGYVPQDEVAIYQSKGALWRKEMESQGPPGLDPETETKPKSKSLKRNERKKEKRQQAALEISKNPENEIDDEKEEIPHAQDVESVASQVSQLALSTSTDTGKPSASAAEGPNEDNSGVDIDKKIRGLKKKIRLAEAQLQKASPQDMKPEQLEKVKKLEGWREELNNLESEKSAEVSAS